MKHVVGDKEVECVLAEGAGQYSISCLTYPLRTINTCVKNLQFIKELHNYKRHSANGDVVILGYLYKGIKIS